MANSRKEYFRRTRKTRMRNLNHSVTGWIGAGLFCVSVGLSFYYGGEAEFFVGTAGLIALVLAAGALVLGILAVREEKVRPVPPRISLVLGLIMTVVLGGLYTYGI
ncbi:MAG: hypothetical protein LIO96_13240 [Lachnospiraceae bacterium]|nr:hypothetical protein [Lachnospiraceae bacterium]